MDARHVDALAKALSVPDSRRRLLALLATLPVLGGLLGILSPEEAEAKDRRRRRKGRHKRRKSPGKRKKGCQPKSRATICAGRCGPVKNRQTCDKTVDCGSCDCSPACDACFTCQGAAGAPGTCVPQQAGTPCGDATSCENGTLQPRSQCDGSGTCVPLAPVSCDPYTQCDGNACATSCAGDGDCVANSYCEAGQCVGDLPNGQVCVQAGQCASGFCVENICCNSVCDGDCESCAIPAALGTCTTEDNFTPCGGGNICCGGSCQACCGNGQCDNPTPICAAGTCVGCSNMNPCPGSDICCSGSCLAGVCCADAECLSQGGNDCVDNQCQCGTGNACSGIAPDCCGSPGSCTDMQTDTANCGTCGNACSNPTPVCFSGSCTACASNSQCSGGKVCCSGSCEQCCGDAQCANPTPICAGGTCTACTADGQCGNGQVCWNGACVCGDVCASGCQFTSVQAAIDAADPSDTIRICAGTYGTASIVKTITLIGAGDGTDDASNTILDGGAARRVVDVVAGTTVTLQGLRITNGKAPGGAGIRNVGALTMTGCTVDGNESTAAGGGIQNQFTLSMTDCTVSNNTTTMSAGGIANLNTATLTNCVVSTNHANGSGGGLFNTGESTMTLNGTQVTGNTSVSSPAGIRNDGTVTLTDSSSVSGNSPGNCGGSGTFNGDGCT